MFTFFNDVIYNLVTSSVDLNSSMKPLDINLIKVITKLPNSEQSYIGKVTTHNYINRQNQETCEPKHRSITTQYKPTPI